MDATTSPPPRTSDFPIEPLFLERWSPRAFTEETLPEAELLTLLEAARWAPSAFNAQPWRYAYARRGDGAFDAFVDLLVPFNQGWARHAAALVFVASKTTLHDAASGKDKPLRSHAFDAGAGWGFLSLQAHLRGWATHAMTGVDFDRAGPALGLPPGCELQTAIAIGRRGDPGALPDVLKGREAPSGRVALPTLAGEGRFPTS